MDIDGLIERLNRHGAGHELIYGHTGICGEAATELSRLQSEVEALRVALEPFSNLAAQDGILGANMNDPLSKWFTVAQIQAARSTIGDGGR
jgi:hypothetical protein